MITIQEIHKTSEDLQKGIIYYQIVSAINNLSLTQREIELLAYTNKRGTISSITSKKGYISVFGSSLATVNNMICKLKKKKLLIKANRKITVNPQLSPNLSLPIVLKIVLKNDKKTTEESD